MPVAATNVPPVPVNLVHTPPACSPVIKLNRSIAATELTQTEVEPSAPALACGVMFTVATDWSFGQGEEPVISYWNVEVVVPAAGVNMPVAATNIPPVPVNLVHTPPACSPIIRLNRSIAATELSQTEVEPSAPAFACGVIFTVATD